MRHGSVCYGSGISVSDLCPVSVSLQRIQVGHDVGPVLLLLEAREGHACSLDELLRVGEELEHGLIRPRVAGILRGCSVAEPSYPAGILADDAKQIWPLLVRTAFVAGVAGRALGLVMGKGRAAVRLGLRVRVRMTVGRKPAP